MPRGDRYNVYTPLTVYNDSDDAKARKNGKSTLYDDRNSVEGAGVPYIDNFSGWNNYLPAIPIWFMPSGGGSGYSIGWINDDDNGFPLTVGDGSGVARRAKAVWVGDSSGVPRKAKAIWVGDSGGTPRKGK